MALAHKERHIALGTTRLFRAALNTPIEPGRLMVFRGRCALVWLAECGPPWATSVSPRLTSLELDSWGNVD